MILSLLATTTCLSLEGDNAVVAASSSLRAGARRAEEGCRSVREIVCGSPDTGTFCEMVTKASSEYGEFGEGLDGDRPYTVFAPTDEAFDRYEGELLNLKEAELYRTLLFHFYEDVALGTEDLGCQGKLVSLTGDMSRTKCKRITAGVYTKHQRGRGNKAIGDFPVIDTETSESACSGVVYKLSHVLLPIAFKPFKPLVIEVEDEDEAVEDEEEEPVVVVDVAEVVEEEKAVAEMVAEEEEKASAPCFFNCPEEEEEEEPAPAPAPAPCFFNCPDEVEPAPAPCFFNCPAEEEPPETPAPVEVVVEEAEAEEEEDAPMPPLKGNGVFLIFFATILLCFMFLCLRK